MSATLPPTATTANWMAEVTRSPSAEIRSVRIPAADPSFRRSPAEAWLCPWPSPLTPRLSFEPMADLGIAAHARNRPDAVAIVDGGRRITYAELHARACRAAHALRALGATAEDRVA